MKKRISQSLIGALVLGAALFFYQESKACPVDQIYAEGTKVWFACIGQNGDSCAKCVSTPVLE